jgi:hypothetical protein
MSRGLFAMNDPCPVCGMIFKREEGYFLSAMYASYVLGTAILVPLYLLATALLPTWSSTSLAFVAVLAYLPFIPAVFRYSRVIWVYLDRTIDPTAINAGSYEKLRARSQHSAKHVS